MYGWQINCLSSSGSSDSENPFVGIPDTSGAYASSSGTSTRGACSFQQSQCMIRVSLCDEDLWNEFNSIGTEMVLTKVGRRVFPSFRVRFHGLQRDIQYNIMMDVERVDENRYKFQDGSWTVSGKGEVPFNQEKYFHPLSAHSGEYIMSSTVSFHKIKLTNSPSGLMKGTFLLHSMHRYQLRVHIARCDMPHVIYSFAFPQTNFITVTAYQNASLSQLKIANNPFARGFRPDGARANGKEERVLEGREEPEAKRLCADPTPSALTNPNQNSTIVSHFPQDANPHVFASAPRLNQDQSNAHHSGHSSSYQYMEQPYYNQSAWAYPQHLQHHTNQFYSYESPQHQSVSAHYADNDVHQWRQDYPGYPNQFPPSNETKWNNGQDNGGLYHPHTHNY